MNCPFCGFDEDKVIESRVINNGYEIRRRRECLQCKKRYTTKETTERQMPVIVKNDGRKEIFDINKIIQGIQTACIKRPISLEEIVDTAKRIEYNILQLGKQEISTNVIGTLVCEELKNLDMVAYIRFASVYMHFENIEQFRKFID